MEAIAEAYDNNAHSRNQFATTIDYVYLLTSASCQDVQSRSAVTLVFALSAIIRTWLHFREIYVDLCDFC